MYAFQDTSTVHEVEQWHKHTVLGKQKELATIRSGPDRIVASSFCCCVIYETLWNIYTVVVLS